MGKSFSKNVAGLGDVAPLLSIVGGLQAYERHDEALSYRIDVEMRLRNECEVTIRWTLVDVSRFCACGK